MSQTALDNLNDPLAVPAAPQPIGRMTQARCPCCGEPKANLTVDLFRLGDDTEPAFRCNECETDFSIADVRVFVAQWSKLLNWLDSVPELD